MRSAHEVQRPFRIDDVKYNPNPAKVGMEVTCNIALEGGMPGTYSVSVWLDIPLWFDQCVATYYVAHDCDCIFDLATIKFIPKSAGTYHISVSCNGNELSSQPNDYLRLTVQ